jgi:hypothetical protein
MALDLHMALGLPCDPTAPSQGRASWGDWWAELCGKARELARERTFSEIVGQLDGDDNA